ncbi:MAG: TonB-dependent receptor plug domain-containing protein [Spongiibacteraceae bacterium]|nr:TonB-dependent receptor plug domain-containing protein [Spongiibacteraceae bacterium]
MLLLCSPLTVAQPTNPGQSTADSRALEEVVVTAQRREQRLQDVGIAVSTYSSEQLKDLGIATATELAQWTPGVFVAGTLGGQTQQFTIRGVTQSLAVPSCC